MSEGIVKGEIVRYAAKQVPKGTPFDVGEQVKVKTVSSNGSKAWVYSVEDPGTSAWVPTRDLEPIEEGWRPPDPERVRIWDALKAANADRAATKHAARDAESQQDVDGAPTAAEPAPIAPEEAPGEPYAAPECAERKWYEIGAAWDTTGEASTCLLKLGETAEWLGLAEEASLNTHATLEEVWDGMADALRGFIGGLR